MTLNDLISPLSVMNFINSLTEEAAQRQQLLKEYGIEKLQENTITRSNGKFLWIDRSGSLVEMMHYVEKSYKASDPTELESIVLYVYWL